MTNEPEPERASQDQRRAVARVRMQRIVTGLENETDISAEGALAANRARLAPLEHWCPSRQHAPPALSGPSGESHKCAASERPAAARRGKGLWLDRLLLSLEVMAVLGLLTAMALLFGQLERLRRDAARFAAGAPTAIPATVGLPTAAPTASQRRAEELPPLLHGEPAASVTPDSGRPAATPTPAPTAVPFSYVGVRVVIPAIRVDAPLVEGDDWETLKTGIGHRIGSARPGEVGNVVISAHIDTYGSIFRDLPDLRPGDIVLIETPTATHRYQVTGALMVRPTETSVMNQTGEPILTMITCYPPIVGSHRLVVTARLVR